LHQWVGLAAGLFLIVIAVSGSALVFENDIDRALNPSTSFVTPGAQPLPVETLLARVQAAFPKDRIGGISVPDKPNRAYELSAGRQSVMIDPYTGTILGARDRQQSFARWVHLLHTRLALDKLGEAMVGWFSVAMLGLAITGLVLWWPRKILTVGGAAPWKRTNFNLHNVLGFYSSLVMLFITLSGVLIAFENTTDPLVRRLNPAAAETPTPQSTPVAGGKRLSIDEAIAIAEQALPGAFSASIGIPNGPKAAFRILKKFPEDRTPAGRSRVYVDQFSGKVLLVENTRTAPLGTRILNLKRSAHTGDIFGAPTQALYFIVSLGIALQAITGALIWFNGRKRTK
jgi:uncharacterized iron-regulated membrane protein